MPVYRHWRRRREAAKKRRSEAQEAAAAKEARRVLSCEAMERATLVDDVTEFADDGWR